MRRKKGTTSAKDTDQSGRILDPKAQTVGYWSKIRKKEAREFPTDDIVELLVANGFSEAQRTFDVLENWKRREVERFCVDLFEFLEQRAPIRGAKHNHSLLTATASGSIRGDVGCGGIGCRTKKLNLLGAYAGLYADKLFLPLHIPHPEQAQGRSDMPEMLGRTISTILQLRPLISAGIVIPVIPVAHYCEQCARREFSKFEAGYSSARAQAQKHMSEFSFTYVDLSVESGGVVGVLFTEGPEEFIHDGRLTSLLTERPAWVPKKRFERTGFRVPKTTVSKARLVERMFTNMAADIFFHQNYSRAFNAAYLTDLPGEAEFFQTVNGMDSEAAKTASLCAHLAHELPVYGDLPLEEIVRIRAEIPDAFDAYRARLTAIAQRFVREHDDIAPEDARGIYLDEIHPAVTRLALEAGNERKRRIKKSAVFGVATIGAITLGATGIVSAPQTASLLLGATGVKLLDNLSDSPSSSPVANDAFYFLLRLEQRRNTVKRMPQGLVEQE